MNGDDIMLLSGSALREKLASHFDKGRLAFHVDPYDALMEMGRRTWPAIVLSAEHKDFPGLCRAARRLQRDAKLFAVCPAAAEPEVRNLTPNVLDDYFIDPPTQSDLTEIGRAASAGAHPPRGENGRLSPGQFAEMVAASRNLTTLKSHLAERLGECLKAPLEWRAPPEGPGERELLLLAAYDAPQVLVPTEPIGEIDEATGALLADVQRVLPSLVAAAERTESLRRLAITDPLTGAYNRRYFYNLTNQILLRARPLDFRVTLLLYDIDDFKKYNDTYSYAAGDAILRETARLMQRITRSHDIVARIGGDEFAVLFWDSQPPRAPHSQPPETAYALAVRFRRAVETMEFRFLGPGAKGMLSISGGLATFPRDGQTCKELLRQADKALKSAKASGKNAIAIVGPRQERRAKR